MGRNINQLLLAEIEKLDKDPDTRRAAMKALKSYVKDLDSKMIPTFLARASEMKDPSWASSTSGECIISLFEVLVRSHARNILPYITNIMDIIIKTLSSNSGSFSLHQACSKVISSIARYGVDPLMLENEKARIISSLCKPLSNALMGSQESTASGAALCLRALVESDNWRFASNDIVNEVCLKVTGALEEIQTQTVPHMNLVIAVSKHNSFIVDAYARSLLRSGIQILTDGAKEKNSQKRLSAAQMINFLMKSVDSRSISSEVASVVDVMEKCQNDHLPFVRDTAFEALRTAKIIAGLKGSPNMGRNDSEVFESDNGTMDLFDSDDPIHESPLSIGQSSCHLQCGRNATRRLWDNEMRTFEFVSIDSKSGTSSDSPVVHSERSTQKNLAQSLQSSSDANFEDSERRNSRATVSPISDEVEWNPLMALNVVENSPNLNMRRRNSQHSFWDDCELQTSGSEFPPVVGRDSKEKNRDQIAKTQRNRYGKALLIFFWFLFMILVAVILSIFWRNDEEVFTYIVPT